MLNSDKLEPQFTFGSIVSIFLGFLFDPVASASHQHRFLREKDLLTDA